MSGTGSHAGDRDGVVRRDDQPAHMGAIAAAVGTGDRVRWYQARAGALSA